MKANKNLTAKEAREISEKNQLTVERAIEVISMSAGGGDTAAWFSNLHEDTVDWLFNNGYTLSKQTDTLGNVYIKVEW